MKQFSSHHFSPARCRLELDAFKVLLDNNNVLEETTHIRPFFEQHADLAVFIGELAYGIVENDLIAHQLAIGGDFACDLKVFCLTYDDLCDQLNDSWNRYDPGYHAKL